MLTGHSCRLLTGEYLQPTLSFLVILLTLAGANRLWANGQ